MTKQRSLAELGKCPECGKPFIPDKKSTRNVVGKTGFITQIWNGHTYKPDCDCLNPNLRLAIG